MPYCHMRHARCIVVNVWLHVRKRDDYCGEDVECDGCRGATSVAMFDRIAELMTVPRASGVVRGTICQVLW
jgi:hypothetical protein